MIMTSLSVHGVKKISASTNDAVPHITIDVEGTGWPERSSITFFIDDEILNARLIEAINRIVTERAAEIEAAKHLETEAA